MSTSEKNVCKKTVMLVNKLPFTTHCGDVDEQHWWAVKKHVIMLCEDSMADSVEISFNRQIHLYILGVTVTT